VGAAHAASIAPTLCSAQHEWAVNPPIEDFRKETGIQVRARTGEGLEAANQQLEEGADFAADVYFTENLPQLMLPNE